LAWLSENPRALVGVVLAVAAFVTFGVATAAADPDTDTLTPELAERVVGEVVPGVERLRGLKFEQPVPVTVIGDAEARRYVLGRLEAFDQIESIRVLQQVYVMLGLVEAGTDLIAVMLDALEEQVAGYYDPGEKAFYLLDDQPQSTVQVLTAHELTHALEDQHFDLDARLKSAVDDDDRLFAVSAIHEGSATLLMMVYMMEAAARAEPGAAGALGGADAMQMEMLETLPPVLTRQLLGPYVLGMHFLVEGDYLALGRGFPVERVDSVYRDPPDSSEQILHPEKYWRKDDRDRPVAVTLDGVAKSLGEGWERSGGGVFGELTLGLLVGAPTPTAQQVSGGAFGPAGWTNEAATGWGGDRWELWSNGEERALLCLTVWDSAEEAAEFASAMPRRGPLRFKRKGSRVAIVAGIEGRRASRLLGGMF
jgi:hypothetical protein